MTPSSAAPKVKTAILTLALLLPTLASAQSVIATLPAAGGPAAIVANPATNKIYLANITGNTVTVIDGATDAETTVPVGNEPFALVANPLTNKIYVLSFDLAITVIDGTTNTTTSLYPNIPYPQMTLNPVTNKIYVSGLSHTMAIIDGATGELSTVQLGTDGGPLAVNPSTNKIYVGCGNCANVNVVDGATNSVTLVATVSPPTTIVVDAATNKIYAANGNATVIDGVTNKTTNLSIDSSGYTYSGALALNAVTNKLYFANPDNGTVVVIDGFTLAKKILPAGSFSSAGGGPFSVTVNPVTNQIYVTNSNDNTVIVIDGAVDEPVATLAVGDNPNVLTANPVTNRIYVVNNAINAPTTVSVIDGSTFGTSSVGVASSPVASAIDPLTNKIYVAASSGMTVINGSQNTTASAAAGPDPTAVAVNPITDRIYVTNGDDATVTVLDGRKNTVTTVAVGLQPAALALNPVTNKIYVANQGSNTVTAIDGVTGTTKTIAVGKRPSSIAVNPATNTIYVANTNSNTVTVIDGANNTTTSVAVGLSPVSIAVNTITNQIFVANSGGKSVTAIYAPSNQTATVTAGLSPVAIAVNEITNKIYVANSGSGDVTVIDGATTATSAVLAGSNPNSVAVDPGMNKIYVVNRGSNSVAVMDGITNSVTTVPTGADPTSVTVNPVTHKAYITDKNDSTVTVISQQFAQNIPLTAAITPLPYNVTSIPDPTFHFTAQSRTPSSPAGVFFQADSWQNAWIPADKAGSAYQGTALSLQPGFHILYAYAADGQIGNATQPLSPLIGNIQAYGFVVTGSVAPAPTATTTSLTINPQSSIYGTPVTLTAAVASTGPTLSGAVSFTYGSTVLGTETLEANGSATLTATLTTTALPLGSNLITATYIGNEAYAASNASSKAYVGEGAVPSVISVSPASGTGLTQLFTARYADPNGVPDVDTFQMLISTSDSIAHACYVLYSPSTGNFFLANDAGTSFSALTGESSGPISNSQCSLAKTSGNQPLMLVNWQITFDPSFAGLKNVYLELARSNGLSTGPVLVGRWTVPPPAIQLSQAALTFTTNPSLPQSQTVYVTNNYTQAISFSPKVEGNSAFQVTNTCPIIQPNATCGFQVTYSPLKAGTDKAWLYLNPKNGPPRDGPDVQLNGLSRNPGVVFSSNTLTFETVVGFSDEERLVITNNLPYTLNSAPVVAGADFSFVNNCSAIPAFSTCVLKVAFTPKALVQIQSYLDFNFVNAPPSTPSELIVEANSLGYPPVIVSTTSVHLVTAVRTNTSSTPISITNYTAQPITLNPVSSNAAFALTNTCSILYPQQTCEITVHYSPNSGEIDTGEIALNPGNAPAGTPSIIDLAGYATSPSSVTVGGQSSDFSLSLTTNVGTFETSVVTVLNGTNHALTLSPSLTGSSSFRIAKPCTAIAANGVCQMEVIFAPTAVGSFTGNLNVNPTNLRPSDNQHVPQVTLNGRGTAMP